MSIKNFTLTKQYITILQLQLIVVKYTSKVIGYLDFTF